MIDSMLMLHFQRGKIDISRFINAVHFPNPRVAVPDGIEYEDAVEFAERLIEQGDKGKQLLEALQRIKEA